MTSKTLVYKVARFRNEAAGKNLQDLLVSSLKKKKTAASRRRETDYENHFRLINFHGPHKGMRVGEFFDYTHGQKQPLAMFSNDVEAFKISSLSPPDLSDFLHSIMYFGIWKNSVILSQSMTLRSPNFEDYLNWLLIDTGALDEGDFVSLADHPPLHKKKEIVNTKGIEFHSPVSFKPANKQVGTDATKSIMFKPGNIGWEALQKILPSELKWPEKINASEVLSNSELDVKLFVSWKHQKKDDSTALLDRISNQLRHIDTEVDYTIHTKSGKISRDEFKLKCPISVSVNDEGLVRRSEMWEKMKQWLTTLISQEKVVSEQ